MAWKAFDARFDLWPLLVGHTGVSTLLSLCISIIGPRGLRCENQNLLMQSDVTLSPLFKVRCHWPNLNVSISLFGA